jgi:hypothetical protein
MTMRMMLLALVASLVMAIAPAHAQGTPVPSSATSAVKPLRFIRLLWYTQGTWKYRMITIDTSTGQTVAQESGEGEAKVRQLVMQTDSSPGSLDTGTVLLPCAPDEPCAGDISTKTVEVNPTGEDQERLANFAKKLATDYHALQKSRLSVPVNPTLKPVVNPALKTPQQVKPLPLKQ